MTPTPIWSEYKTTFCQSSTTLDYLFSKGYYPAEMQAKYFKFDPFQNYRSSDLATSHIGFLNTDKYILYISEDRFKQINQILSDVSIDMFEYAFSTKEDREIIILKRGICMYLKTNGFKLFDIEFTNHKSDDKTCRLDLVKILDDERIGWVPVVPDLIDLTCREEVRLF